MVCVDSTLLLSQLFGSLLGVFEMLYMIIVVSHGGHVRRYEESTLSGVKSIVDGVNCTTHVYRKGELIYERKRNYSSDKPLNIAGYGERAQLHTTAMRKRSFLKLS
jgi:hypothetical protein